MNVSGIVVHTKPELLEDVIGSINAIDQCEVHYYDTQGRIVATIEGITINDQMEIMKRIQCISFVYGASVVYSYCKDEVSRAINRIDEAYPLSGMEDEKDLDNFSADS